MSDEFLPPSAPPSDDERHLPDPDENGYGYYEVEEYSGDPALRPLVDPPFAPPTPAPTGPTGPTGSTAAVDERGFGPPVVDQNHGPDDPDDPDDMSAAGSGWVRSGKVPFADRNWRIPLIGVLITAMVVLVSFILLLPDDGLELEASAAIAELRESPVKQWDEDLDGFSSAVAADDTSMYLMVVKTSSTELVAFDLASGDERWSTELGPGGTSAAGTVSLVDGSLLISATLTGNDVFVVVDPVNGKIEWQAPVDNPAPTTGSAPTTGTASTGSTVSGVAMIDDDSVIVGTDPAGGFLLSPVDVSSKQIGDAVRADAFFVADDVLYLDVDGTLTTADPATLQQSGDFRYPHGGSIVDPFRIGDDVVLGSGEQLVRVGDDGAEKYSFDPQIGIIRSLMPMNGDQVLVSSATRMRVVALNDDEAEASTAVRSGVSPVLIHDIEGDEFIVAFDGTDRGVAAAAMRVMRVEDDDFDQVSEIELTSSDGAPAVMVTGDTAYTTSFGRAPTFIAFDLKTGEWLWSLSLVADDVVTVGSEGMIVLTREDDESVVGYYAKDG